MKLVLIQAEFKVVRRKALLVIDRRVIVLTGAPPFPFPFTWFTGNAEAENYTNRKFIYLFQNLNKKKQEFQGKNILIHVSKLKTVKNHIIKLKNDYNLYLVLIFFTDMNCIFHSRKWTWQGFLSQNFLRKEYEAVL